jgi:4-amino-4-deoxy-L-arabinose transferase-like glycosyltransferase
MSVGRRAISREALAAAGLACAFIGLTLVWLARDRTVPTFDFGTHLTWSLVDRDLLRSGDLLGPFRIWTSYPPLGHVVGALGALVGGAGVSQPVLALNLVFVPLLCLGAYNVGRLAFGRQAGLFAVVFALATPMVSQLFHGALLDTPETAMVAVAVWLLLASERFSRRGATLAAGLACALGALTKETFPLFVVGLIAVMLIRGGWRERRGMLLFAAPILLLAVPWYAYHLDDLHGLAAGSAASIGGGGVATSAAAGSVYPPRLSAKNAGWYLWSDVNFQLLAPLLALAAVGVALAVLRLVRRRTPADVTPELLVGGFVSWVGISYVMPHDSRYSLPALVYLATLGTGWLVGLPRRAPTVAGAVLAAILLANTAGVDFGVGSPVVATLPGAPASSGLGERRLTFYTTAGAPVRDGDLLGLLRALRRSGVQAVHWDGVGESVGTNFTRQGIGVLAGLAGMAASIVPDYHGFGPHDAFLLRRPRGSLGAPACLRLDQATSIWIVLGDPTRPGVGFFCPLRRPAAYR